MNLRPWRKPDAVDASPSTGALTFEEYVNFFTYNGTAYGAPWLTTTMPGSQQQPVARDFLGFVNGVYRVNGVAAACIFARQRVFSEARFQYRRRVNGRPAGMFGTNDLAVLEHPWPGGTTGDLLVRALTDADLAGNCFIYRKKGSDTLRRLRPDWTWIVLGTEDDVDQNDPGSLSDVNADVIGYAYQPGGPASGRDPVPLRLDEVCHFAPIPDPEASFRGMSWLRPVLREILSDGAAQDHKLKFFENGGTPNLAVVFSNPNVKKETFDTLVAAFRDAHEGVKGAYSTLFLAGGADVKTVGADLKQLDFAETQGQGETRICAVSGVPPIVVGLREGLRAATYSNYATARRMFADITIRPLWRNFAGSLETIIPVPAGAELAFDDRDVAFVQEDQKDLADVQQMRAAAVASYVMAGFDPDSVVQAIADNDLTLLTHTGLPSVQLQPAPSNGNGSVPAAALRAAVWDEVDDNGREHR